MEISAKCKMDFDACRALAHLNVFKKANPKKRFIAWIIFSAILALAIVFVMLLFHDVEFIELLCLVIVLLLLECFMYFVIPKISYNNLAKMKESVF